MSKFKLIALDLDGSLLQNNLEISPASRRWIKKAERAGVIVAFATGRSRDSSEPYWELVSPKAPMILLNGAEVWLNRDKLLARHFLPAEHVPRLRQLAEEYGAMCWGHTEEAAFRRGNWPKNLPLEQNWLKFGLAHQDREVIESLRKIISRLPGVEVTSSSPINLEISKGGVSKAWGLAAVSSLLGIAPAEVAVVGDSLNDLSMIKWAGFGAAMGNAEKPVKEAADYITTSNEEDGVAEFIRLVLE